MKEINLIDLKVGDKVLYIYPDDHFTPEIATYTRYKPGDFYWFTWENGREQYLLPGHSGKLYRYNQDSDEELIHELHRRGYSGSLNKTVTTTITVVV